MVPSLLIYGPAFLPRQQYKRLYSPPLTDRPLCSTPPPRTRKNMRTYKQDLNSDVLMFIKISEKEKKKKESILFFSSGFLDFFFFFFKFYPPPILMKIRSGVLRFLSLKFWKRRKKKNGTFYFFLFGTSSLNQKQIWFD